MEERWRGGVGDGEIQVVGDKVMEDLCVIGLDRGEEGTEARGAEGGVAERERVETI